MRLFTLAAAVVALALSAAATAADYPPAIQSLVDKGFTITTQFDAGDGLTGYVANANGRNVIVYALPDGKRALVGALLDENGRNLTAEQAEKYIPKPDLGAAWKKLEQSAWFAEGAEDPKTIIYEFADPNCPFCHLFWLANQPYMKVGLQVRHVLVGFLTPTSKGKAAAILEADDPAAAYRKNEENYRTGVAEDKAGGIEPAKDPKPETLAKLEANAKLMQELGVRGTPGVFYKDSEGKVQRIGGMPKLSKLPEIYGLPAQPITDSRLKRYE